MNFSAGYVPLFMCIAFILLNHVLASQGCSYAHKKKYYPEEAPVKTIVLDNGDVIDCVDFCSQPAMRDPNIRRNPQLRARRAENKSHDDWTNEKLSGSRVERWSCPQGSVPFLKATKAGPLNLSAVEDFARSRAQFFPESNTAKPQADPDNRREYSVASISGGEYYGAQGTFNVWQPTLEHPREMSILQMWVARKSRGNVQTLEAGWMVQPSLFGDQLTRFFFFTTNNNYQTILYGDNIRRPADNNLMFVREDNQVPFGMQITPVSTFDGRQVSITFKIKKNEHGNWDLWFNRIRIGFWPSGNYRDGFPDANKAKWGGEIMNLRTGTGRRHTSTQMGSGHFSGEGRGRAAYIKNMGIFNEDDELYYDPDEMDTLVTNPMCYDLSMLEDSHNGHYMTLGGPGYNQRCP